MMCPKCESTDLIGPFEMDGVKDGQYHVRGLWWIFCRTCRRHTSVPCPT